MPSQHQAIWTKDHVDYLELLDKQQLTHQEMSVVMSKHFKMRITANHVGSLLKKMRNPHHEFFRNTPYRVSGARRT